MKVVTKDFSIHFAKAYRHIRSDFLSVLGRSLQIPECSTHSLASVVLTKLGLLFSRLNCLLARKLLS